VLPTRDPSLRLTATSPVGTREPGASNTRNTGAPARNQNFLFVDNVRFWSMFAIIAMHTSVIFWYLGRPVPRLTQAITTPLKFGTIAFFLISGFLLGERLETCKPLDYLGRRINKVFLPWSIWFVAMCLFSTLANLWHLHVNPIFSLQAVPVLLHEAVQTLFTSAFWFVPNLLLALSILLLFRSWLRDMRFGAVLLAFNLFYVVNIYARWVAQRSFAGLPGLRLPSLAGSLRFRSFQQAQSLGSHRPNQPALRPNTAGRAVGLR